MSANPQIEFHKSLDTIPAPTSSDKPRLVLISGRTCDNPKLLTGCIALGVKTVYLEKPGAPTVVELETMSKEAEESGVTVLMGYNKNVCKYVSKVREFAASVREGAHVTFVSNNTYENTPESLGECFERNAEGMLKNMAIHELALLVSFYGVTVDTIVSVVADKEFSSMQELAGPSGTLRRDFDKIKFSVTTKNGQSVSVQADRCGGDVSYGVVHDKEGVEIFRYSMPDDVSMRAGSDDVRATSEAAINSPPSLQADIANVKALEAKYPGAMPYFFSQDPDYITVKERVAKFCANGTAAEGVASLQIAIDTMKVAEFLTPKLQELLS